MNKKHQIPPPEIREKHIRNLQKICTELQEFGAQLDEVNVLLDRQIAAQPQRKNKSVNSLQR